MRDRDGGRDGRDQAPGSGVQRDAPGVGKQTLISTTFAPVQLRVGAGPQLLQPDLVPNDAHVPTAATRGIAGPAGALPHLDAIQRAFGRHDISGVRAHVGGPAAEATRAMGAEAYAMGDHVAFANAPSLHTAAHEVAHVVQQRGGVHLKGGVGAAGDRHEQHANQVADAVVRGDNAEDLLDAYASGTGGEATAVQRQATGDEPAGPQSSATPAGPTATAAPSSVNAGAGQLAHLLASPPAPGLSDPVVSYLLSLPMPALLDQLADAVDCGYALQLEARVAATPPILMAALQATELARTRPITPAHPVLQRAGTALDRVSRDQQVQILSWMLARGGVSIQATTLVEGVIAMREDGARGAEQAGDGAASGEHTLGENVESSVATVQGAAAGMPPPINPGPWEPPGDQPGGLYVGTEAHDAIGAVYAAAHRGDEVFLNNSPISTIVRSFHRIGGSGAKLSALSEDERARRPDILNVSRQHIYEIKPETARAEATAKVTMYLGLFAKAGIAISLGPVGEPGTLGQLPAPAGVFMFESVEPGVITYKYRHGRLIPVPVPAPGRARSRKGARWRWELKPLKLTPAQEQAIVTTTVGGAMLILVMILLAPVGA